MDDLLLEIFSGLAELFLEAFFQLVGAVLLDLASRAMPTILKTSDISSRVLTSLGYGLQGVFVGGLSLPIAPHPLIHPSRIHGISLLVSPFICGLVMSLIGSVLRRHDKKVVKIETFSYGFAFAFGMAFVRFCFVK